MGKWPDDLCYKCTCVICVHVSYMYICAIYVYIHIHINVTCVYQGQVNCVLIKIMLEWIKVILFNVHLKLFAKFLF